MSKCNWEHRDRCCWGRGSETECRNVEPFECQHKAAPVTCPVCPVCGNSLNNARCSWLYVCDRYGCGYSQPDAAQRPKRPEPNNGHHAGEWREPVQGESVYVTDALTGETVLLHNVGPHWNGEKRWIAVPDAPAADHIADTGKMVAPAPEPVPVVPVNLCDSCAGNAGACLRSKDVRTACNSYHPVAHKAAKPEPVPVVPVDRTFEQWISDKETPSWVRAAACSTVVERALRQAYAAAKSPDHIRGVTEMVGAIEPLDPMAGTLERTEKINEIAAWSRDVSRWINAKGGLQ